MANPKISNFDNKYPAKFTEDIILEELTPAGEGWYAKFLINENEVLRKVAVWTRATRTPGEENQKVIQRVVGLVSYDGQLVIPDLFPQFVEYVYIEKDTSSVLIVNTEENPVFTKEVI